MAEPLLVRPIVTGAGEKLMCPICAWVHTDMIAFPDEIDCEECGATLRVLRPLSPQAAQPFVINTDNGLDKLQAVLKEIGL